MPVSNMECIKLCYNDGMQAITLPLRFSAALDARRSDTRCRFCGPSFDVYIERGFTSGRIRPETRLQPHDNKLSIS